TRPRKTAPENTPPISDQFHDSLYPDVEDSRITFESSAIPSISIDSMLQVTRDCCLQSERQNKLSHKSPRSRRHIVRAFSSSTWARNNKSPPAPGRYGK